MCGFRIGAACLAAKVIMTHKCLNEESLSSNYRNQDFTPSSNTVVFAAHFPPKAFVTEDTVTKPDGSTLTVKRHHVKLVEDACPSIFPKQPKFLSQQSVAQRNPPSKRQEVKLEMNKPITHGAKTI